MSQRHGAHRTTFVRQEGQFVPANYPRIVLRQQTKLVVECLNDRGIEVQSWPDVGYEVDATIEAECYELAVAQTTASQDD